MISDEYLSARLIQWGDEYRSGRYEHVGWHSKNLLQVCHEHQGFKPDSRGYVPIAINTPADEIEEAVNALQLGGGANYRAAMCLRVCYVGPTYWPEKVRLQELYKLGVSVSRTGYYDATQHGRFYISGFLDRKQIA